MSLTFDRVETGGSGPPGRYPVVVDQSAVGDREHPRPEGGLVTRKVRQSPGDGNPRLRSEILGVVAGAGAEIAAVRIPGNWSPREFRVVGVATLVSSREVSTLSSSAGGAWRLRLQEPRLFLD